MGFKILSSWGVGNTNTKFTIRTTIFVFSSKTLFFAGLGTFFGTFYFFLSKEDFAFKIKESFIRIKVVLFRYDLRELN